MSTVEQIDANAIAPDGIEPVEHLRGWRLEGGYLLSMNYQEWRPGEPLAATCQSGAAVIYSWNVVRHGMTLDAARDFVRSRNASHSVTYFGAPLLSSPPRVPPPPAIALPDGYGFSLDEKPRHAAPQEDCTCGIYAADNEGQIPSSADVFGKVKLWGKIIPGEKGVRAEFAYPSEFHVRADLADDPVLKSFGVPIIVKNEKDGPRRTRSTIAASYKQLPFFVRIALALDACAIVCIIIYVIAQRLFGL